MAKYNVLRDHPNAEPLVKAWDAAGEGASFSELLLSTFPPRPWLSSEASRKKLESRLSKVSLASSPSSQPNWRNTRKHLDDAIKYGKSSGWDTDAEPYTGPLPTYEDIEAIRIIGSKPTGCGMLPNPIQNRINDARVEFLLEDPSNRVSISFFLLISCDILKTSHPMLSCRSQPLDSCSDSSLANSPASSHSERRREANISVLIRRPLFIRSGPAELPQIIQQRRRPPRAANRRRGTLRLQILPTPTPQRHCQSLCRSMVMTNTTTMMTKFSRISPYLVPSRV